MNLAALQTERFDFDLHFDRMRTEELAVRLEDDTFSRVPVREETLLSSWDAPNWIIEGSRVRQIRSRSGERGNRKQRILDECGAFAPFVTIQVPPIPTLAFGDWGWTGLRAARDLQRRIDPWTDGGRRLRGPAVGADAAGGSGHGAAG